MENMNKRKQSEELLAEIYRNCHLALQSISDILPEIEDAAIKAEIVAQHEEYEKICGKAAALAHEKNIEVKEPNAFKKAMMWSAIKMNTLTDGSRSHIADMMIQGTVMGVTSLRTSLSEVENDGDEQIVALARELVEAEELFEKRLKTFL